MDTRTILADLKAELTRLNQAIAALESLDGTAPAMPRATTSAAKAAATQAKKRGLPRCTEKIIGDDEGPLGSERRSGRRPI